jgi:hypothetical protein
VEVGTNHISEAAVPASEAKSAKASPASVITEDLASFVVANQIILTAPTTIEQVKQHFSHNAEIAPLVNHTLNALQDAELISIQDGKIEALVNDLSVGSDIDALERFVPNLFKRTASQILNDGRKPSAKKDFNTSSFRTIRNSQTKQKPSLKNSGLRCCA